MAKHSDAVESAIAENRRKLTATDEPLLELCRTLAGQMDASSDPTAKLSASYLTAVRSLQARLDALPEQEHRGSTLARLRAVHYPHVA